jgi:hypothetical protein
VDVVVEVASRTAFYAFEERLRALGFTNDLDDGLICRWLHHDGGLILDAMPADPTILGFDNRWQGASIPHAIERTLPSGAAIRASSPPYLLAQSSRRSRGVEKATFSGAATSVTSSRSSTAAKS